MAKDIVLHAKALSQLGVTTAQLQLYPTITPQLLELTKIMRKSDHELPYGMGGDMRNSWPRYLQMSDAPEATQVLGAYLKVDRLARAAAPIEAYCLAAGVAPSRILEIIQLMCMRLSGQLSQMLTAINHPRVVQHNIDRALDHDGEKWTEMLHKATGFLPTPRGPSQTVHLNVAANASAQAATVAAPAPESIIRRAVDRFNDSRPQPTLPPTSAVEIPVIEELESVEHED